ncbi:glucose-1-phosphate adenylyltransferase subunit GlgD [Salinicoccus sp. HZC-1]|uniref:glucose-1-phosphate adenylyltransferase subunit GlgD n=1 Tax=Salinicoccus sp. HZC-1 TaxID=3385497 RepID=UPI00398A7B5B
MNKDVLGLINLQPEHDYLEDLTYFRSGGSVPFMGRYRLIDFTLTNIANSGVKTVGVFAGNKFRSLLDHLSRKEDFGFEGRNSRIFVLPPDWNDPSDISQGDLKHFHNHSDFFSRFKGNHILISGSQFITNTNYSEAIQYHKDQDNDITFISERRPEDDIPSASILKLVTEDDSMTGFTHDENNNHIYTGVYIIKKEVLRDIVRECIDNYKPDLFHNGIREKMDHFRTGFYDIDATTYYFNSIHSYFKNSMALLEKDKYRDFFHGENLVRTKISTNPPTLYKKDSAVKSSILANGVKVEGTVDRSVISRNVTVKKGATVKNSVIFANCMIEPGAYIENVILDKDVTITEDRRLIGSEDKPYVVAKRSTI